jgi:purine-nucleoside phosphorylase
MRHDASDKPAAANFTALAEQARGNPPEVALVLGSGMGPVARRVTPLCQIPFADVPGMSATTVSGHAGSLTLGTWAGRRILLFEGRLHFYEGCPWRSVTLPVETAAFLGVRTLLLTNAAGGIHEALAPGSLMAIQDHIEWTRDYCWRPLEPTLHCGSRPSPYSTRLLQCLRQAGKNLALDLHEGVYACVTGPSYETPAEIRALRVWGAAAVGMSTAREIRAGHDRKLECAAISCITNRAAGLSEGPIHHGEVLSTAAARAEPLADLIAEFLRLSALAGS